MIKLLIVKTRAHLKLIEKTALMSLVIATPTHEVLTSNMSLSLPKANSMFRFGFAF